jgi:serine protease AprX
LIIRAKAGMRSALEAAGMNRGHGIRADHDFINAFSVEVDDDDLASLAADPRVESVSFDATIHGDGVASDDPLAAAAPRAGRDQQTPPNPAPVRSSLGLTASSATGRGVTVALIDSGLEPSADFSGRIKAFYDFTRPGAPAAAPSDGYGHGTHIAGLIGAAGKLSGGSSYMGVAPRVDFVVLKVLDSQGLGSTSDVISAIQFATAHRVSLGIDIINLSIGHPIYEPAASDPLVQAVQAASRAGLVVVVSAGNYGTNPETGQAGYAGITSPGNAPAAITVGAVSAHDTVSRRDDRIATYSSRGPTWYDGMAKPDVVATGSQLASNAARNGTLSSTYPALLVGSDYIRLSGTSMATGVVGGLVALMRKPTAGQRRRALTANAVRRRLSSAPSDRRRRGRGDNLTPGAAPSMGRAPCSSRARSTRRRAATPSGSGRRWRR